MFKIDSPYATLDNHFQPPDPVSGDPGTRISYEWLNAVQDEIINVIVSAGLVPSKVNSAQLLAAITIIAGGGGGGGGSAYWGDAVANVAALAGLTGMVTGQIRYVTDVQDLYRYNGSAWVSFINISDIIDRLLALENAGYVTLTGAQTLTNKTLTAPAISAPTGIVKADVGLGNVTNTSDANKPVSTAQQTALDLKIDLTQKGAALGVVPLDASSKISSTYLPEISIDRWAVVANQTARLAYVSQGGDGVKQTDNGFSYVLKDGGVYSTNADWIQIGTGANIVSVNGDTGPAVVLTSDNITEGSTNKYFLDARALAAAGATIRPVNVNTNAVSRDIVLMDSTPGIRLVYAPTGAAGTWFQVVDSKRNAGVYEIPVFPPPGTAFQGGIVDDPIILNVAGAWVYFAWNGSAYSYWMGATGTASSGMTPVVKTASFTAANYSINQIDHTSGGIIVGTLPKTALAAVVTFVYAKGNVDSSANYLVAAPSPTGATDSIDGNAIGDGESYQTTLYAVTYSKAAGASVWYGQYQRISVAPPATATDSGLVSGETTSTATLSISNFSITSVTAKFYKVGKLVTMRLSAIPSGTATAAIIVSGIPTAYQFDTASSIALAFPDVVVAGSGQNGQITSNSQTSFNIRNSATSAITSGTFQSERDVYFSWITS